MLNQPPDTEDTLLRISGLTKSFGGQNILNGIEAQLHRGEIVLLRGENGSGKTTLLNLITGILEPDSGTIEFRTGRNRHLHDFSTKWWAKLAPFSPFTPERVSRQGIGRTWQDNRLFSSLSVWENIAAADQQHPGENPLAVLLTPRRVARHERELAASSRYVLVQVGLPGREASSADKISVGQSKRVAIARAVASGAKVLFLDEPLAGLDRQGIQGVLELIERLNKDKNVTFVIVEHVFNQQYLAPLITTDWLLQDGRLMRTSREVAVTDKFSRREAWSPTLQAQGWFQHLAGDSAILIEEELPRGALVTRIRRPDIYRPAPGPLLSMRDLVVSRGSIPIVGVDEEGRFTGINLDIVPGEIIVLQAPNGWGKTTLLEGLVGLARVSQGTVELEGANIHRLSTSARTRKGITLARSSANVFNTLSIHEMLALTPNARSHPVSRAPDNRRIYQLSGGQKQRLAVSVMRCRPESKVALFDEPFSMLDQSAIAEATQWLIPTPSSASLIAVPKHYMSRPEIGNIK